MNQILVEELRLDLGSRQASWNSEEYIFFCVLLDAIIQSGAAVPREVLEPLREKWVVPYLILAQRSSNSDLGACRRCHR